MGDLSGQSLFGLNALPSTGVLRGSDKCFIDIVAPKSAETWSVEMDATPFVIGRSAEARLRLDHDTVSRQHAQLYRDPFNRVWIHDLASRNGIKVNDQKVAERLIEPGDVIRIGQFLLRIRMEPTAVLPASLPVAEILPTSSELEISSFEPIAGSRIAVEHLSAILELGARLSQTSDPAQRAKLTCELLTDPQLAGEAVWLLRVEKQRPDRPQMLFGPFVCARRTPDTLHVSATLLIAVVKSGAAQLATNEPSGHLLALSLPADVRRIAAAACPVAVRQDFIDVLYAIYPAKQALPEWLALTSLVANQFSQSEAVWAARRDLEARAVIDHDLKQASKIQKSLLPSNTEIKGLDISLSSEPCRWVGGDYVDIVALPDGRVLLAIADVAGKGMQAALVASWIHTMVHAGARAGLSLESQINSINDHLRSFLPNSSFVTSFVVALDPASGAFEYVNAGHPPALLLKSNKQIIALDEGSTPLGLEQHSVMVTAGQLDRDEVLLLYTDGWTDMSGENGQPMGFAAFSRCIAEVWSSASSASAKDLMQRASQCLSRHERLNNVADDRTLLVVRRKQ